MSFWYSAGKPRERGQPPYIFILGPQKVANQQRQNHELPPIQDCMVLLVSTLASTILLHIIYKGA